jgi:dUTP pyrophosphatase
MEELEIKFKKLSGVAKIPTQAKESDAGYDLYSCQTLFIAPMERAIISIGIAIEIPKGYYGRVAPRSGLAVKHGIDVLAGVVDSGYRDELKVVLINLNPPEFPHQQDVFNNIFGSRNRFVVKQGDRIAQLIIEKCHSVKFLEQESLSDSQRNIGGFGSSGN